MFTEKEMTQALKWFIGLYEPDDYEHYDEEEYGDDGNLPFSEVCQALRNSAVTVYEYRVDAKGKYGFNYCGKELFGQRGILINSYCTDEVQDETISTIRYSKELWLLEDMNFVIVSCISMTAGNEEMHHTSEYRCLVKKVEGRNDLFFSPEDLLDCLELECVPVWEGEATIYEL